MGLSIRHVVLVSAVLSIGSFVYMVGFSPMDEAVYARAGAINQVPGRQRLINTIRRSMAQGQLRGADRMADVLMEHNPEDPSAYFWRAMVYRQMGDESSAKEIWSQLDEFLEGLESWEGRYSLAQLGYFNAWSRLGVGELEESQDLFRAVAQELESRSRPDDGEITNSGVLYNLACYRAMSGDISSALGYWERAVAHGYGLDNEWWRVDPDLESLHAEERFWEGGSVVRQNERD